MVIVKTAMYLLIYLDPGNTIPILYDDVSIARFHALLSDKSTFYFYNPEENILKRTPQINKNTDNHNIRTYPSNSKIPTTTPGHKSVIQGKLRFQQK